MTDKATPGVNNPASEAEDDIGEIEWTKLRNRPVFLGFLSGEGEEYAKVTQPDPTKPEWFLTIEGGKIGDAFGSSNSARMFAAGYALGQRNPRDHG